MSALVCTSGSAAITWPVVGLSAVFGAAIVGIIYVLAKHL